MSINFSYDRRIELPRKNKTIQISTIPTQPIDALYRYLQNFSFNLIKLQTYTLLKTHPFNPTGVDR